MKKYFEYQEKYLFPINLKESNHLEVKMSFHKVCKDFPRDEIKNMKFLQKKNEIELLSHYYYKKNSNLLKEEESNHLKSVLSKRANTPTKEKFYIKFLVQSILLSLSSDIKIPNMLEMAQNNVTFYLQGNKYDISINPKNQFIREENFIFIDYSKLVDNQGLIIENLPEKILQLLDLPISVNSEELLLISKNLNNARENYIKAYRNFEDNRIDEVFIKRYSKS